MITYPIYHVKVTPLIGLSEDSYHAQIALGNCAGSTIHFSPLIGLNRDRGVVFHLNF